MKDHAIFIAIAIVLAAAIVAFVQPSAPGVLSVSGDGEVFAAPDTAELGYSVNAIAQSVEAAKENVDMNQANVVAALLAEGVSREKIQTGSYSIYKEERWDKDSDSYVFVGWRVSTTTTVKSNAVNSVGRLIDAIAGNGGEPSGSISFYVEDDTAFRNEALTKAIGAAKAKAEVAASGAGVRLVKIQSISPSYNYYPIYRAYDSKAVAGGAPVPESVIEPGESKLSASVGIVYEIA